MEDMWTLWSCLSVKQSVICERKLWNIWEQSNQIVWNQLQKLKISCTRPVKERQKFVYRQEQNNAHGKHERVMRQSSQHTSTVNHMHWCAEGLALQCLSFSSVLGELFSSVLSEELFSSVVPYSGKFLRVQTLAKIPFLLLKKFLRFLIFTFSASYWPRPFIVAGLTEDKRCPVGKGRTSSAGLK